MTTILVLVLFACVAGVIKPYVKGLKRAHFGVAAVAIFILIGILAPAPKTTPAEKSAASDAAVSSATSQVAEPPKRDDPENAETVSKWVYSQDRDEMRGTVSRFASLNSENEVDLDFPYGTVSGQIWIRKRPSDGLNVAFAVEKGQVLCNSFSGGTIYMKFDKGAVRRFGCSGSSDGSSETAFIDSAGKVLALLKRSKIVIVEAEFFQQGRQQFRFDTSGLKWK